MQAWDRSNGLAWKAAYDAMAADGQARAVYRAGRLIAVCLPFGLVLGCSPAPARGLTDTRFDAAIARAAKRHLPTGPHWLRYKAQLWQESRLDPDAVSPVGARGLAQFMPGTWADTIRDLDLAANLERVRHAKNGSAAGSAALDGLRRSAAPGSAGDAGPDDPGHSGRLDMNDIDRPLPGPAPMRTRPARFRSPGLEGRFILSFNDVPEIGDLPVRRF